MESRNNLLLPRENIEKQLRSCEGYRRNNPWWAGRSYRIALTCLSAMDARDAAEARVRELEATDRIPADVEKRNTWAKRIVDERDAAQEAAGSAERRLGELEAQSAAMRDRCACDADVAAIREAAELALDTVGNGGNVDVANALRDALSSDAGRALLERVEALERDLAEKSARCSRGAHAIIDLIGADGPEHIDETCARASRRIEAQDRRIAALERVANAAGALMDVLAEFGTLDGMSQSVDAVTDALDAMEAKR